MTDLAERQKRIRRTRTMFGIGAALAAAAAVSVGLRAIAPPLDLPEVTTLESGAVIERSLARGEEHRYRISLEPGEYVSVVVEQRGIDVIAHTRRPDDSLVADVQENVTRLGREQVDIVADAGGAYSVAVTRAPGPNEPGSYAIRLAARRPAATA